jgi:NAD+ kinase
MKLLLVHKKSRYEQLVLDAKDAHIAALVEHEDVSVAALERAHDAHASSLDEVVGAVVALGLEHDVLERGQVGEVEGYDLVVTVGGDGTVLDISHKLGRTPILAINSDPSTSVGYFCAGTKADAGRLLGEILSGELAPKGLSRFRVLVNDVVSTPPVLNDVLVTHQNPGAVSSYILRVDDKLEPQRSSGVWISTPAGSTAAIRSAGGYVIPLRTDILQYLVREPYAALTGGYRLAKGILPVDATFELISKMQHGVLFIDGPHISVPFRTGDRLRVDASAPKLRIYGLDEGLRL